VIWRKFRNLTSYGLRGLMGFTVRLQCR
jgi:hypothetical protein